MAAITSIHRNVFQKEKIEFVVNVSNKKTVIEQPYHTIQIIVNNLIINPIKALSDVDNKKIALDIEIKDGICYLAVRDNGCIIEDHIRQNIFKYGFSTTGGSGIGLFQVNECLKKMKGGISIVNEPEESNYVKSFNIYFPLNTNN